MPVFHVDGTPLHYLEHGCGTPLVLVHGSASDRRTWDAAMQILGPRYRTVAYSRRHHRPNPPIGEHADYSMEEHVRDLAALVRGLELAPAHLVGHSYGALVALLFAMRTPRAVRTLVLVEPPALTLFVSNRPRLREILGLALTSPRTALAILGLGARGMGPAAAAARRGDLDAALRRSGRAVLGRRYFAHLSAARLEQARSNTIAAEFLGSGLPPLREAELRAMRTPTLVVTGRDSPAVFHRLAERLVEILPSAKGLCLQGASHLVHEDRPHAFAEAVSSFLHAV